jgi:hypothetical protein
MAGADIACPACRRPLTVPPVRSLPPPVPSLPRARRRPPLVAAALVLVGLLLGAALVLAWRPARGPAAAVPPLAAAPAVIPATPAAPQPIARAPAPPARPAPVIIPVPPPSPVVARTKPSAPPNLVPPPQAPKAPDVAQRDTVLVKHLHERSEDELQKEVARMPEVALDLAPFQRESAQVMALARRSTPDAVMELAPRLAQLRPDLVGLPFRMGDDCHLGPAAAERLEVDSVALRNHLTTAAQPAGGVAPVAVSTLPEPSRLAEALNAGGRHSPWLRPEAVPALQQLLTAEDTGIREILVKQLARIDGKPASIALARRALFDLNPGVREAAVTALRSRPADEYRPTLLDGFRYPWPVVADHAAEALVALGLKEAVPVLLTLLDQPDPDQPYHKPAKDHAYVREVVRVNHLRNCVLCHAASLATTDKVRGRLPDPNQALPPPSSREYYADTSGNFVRADVTYLRQDFSVPLPVPHPDPWPAVQRFDFLVRERPATPLTPPEAGSGEYHRAIFFALRELTGRDPGPSADDWRHLFLGQARVTPLAGNWRSVVGVAADSLGRLWVNKGGKILRAQGGKAVPLAEGDFRSLAADTAGNLLACSASNVVIIDSQGQVRVLANSWDGQPLGGPLHLAADRAGGVYFTDAATDSSWGAVYYRSAHGVLTRLRVGLKRPCGVAVAPDGKTLYLRAAGAAEVMAYPLEGAGQPGPGRVFCRLESSSTTDGALAVDGRGNVLVPAVISHLLYVFHAQGARLGHVPLPDAPRECTTAADGRAVYVTTPTGVCAVRFDSPVELAAR